MRKAAGWKKAMASLVSAATLFSCTITGTMNFSTVTAADGANYAEALAMSLYFFDANECGTEVIVIHMMRKHRWTVLQTSALLKKP